MKKRGVVAMVLSVAALSFLVGRYEKGHHTVQAQRDPVYARAVDEAQDETDTIAPGAVKVGPGRQQLIGVKVAAAERKGVTYTLRLYGRVVPDETRIYRVNASTDCWIRELSDVTTGSIVQRNQVLAEALAPAYYNAQVTYLIALDNIDRIKKQLGGDLRHQQGDLANNQIRMAVQALQNLGITDAQTEELANTRQARPYLQIRSPTHGVVLSRKVTLRQWFRAAEEFYTIADIGKVWVYADVYEDEGMYLRPGMKVTVKPGQLGRPVGARVGRVLPLFDPAARTLKVRIDVDNPGYDLRPDMFVDVELPISLPATINVPADAVLDSGTKAVVYVSTGKGIFEPRRVETGWRVGGLVEITRGLAPGERVVVSGNFLIDSESRMQTVTSGRNVDTGEGELPSRSLQGRRKGGNGSDRGLTPLKGRSWADMLEPGESSHARASSVRQSRQHAENEAKPPSESGVVDWDGHEENPVARNWGSWGMFPGAEYLGLKQKGGSSSAPQLAPQGAGDRKARDASSSAGRGSRAPAVPDSGGRGGIPGPRVPDDLQSPPDR